MASLDEVVVSSNEVVDQASGDSPSSSESRDEILNGSLHSNSRQTVRIIQMNSG